MDRGWSWVTMMAAFGVHFSCGGFLYTAGYLRLILLQNADQYEKRYVTWITSTYSGFICVVGPIASVLVYKCGCRTSVIVGASLETLGLVLSFFVRNKWIYFITYSFMAGMGSGLTYTPVVVLLSFNFDRYFSMASGFAVSGEGIGLVCMPIVMNFFFERYGLQGSFLLLGGVTLQKMIFAALMRPSSAESEQISQSGTVKNQQYTHNLPKATEFEEQKSMGTYKENTIIEEECCTGSISYILFNEDERKEDETGLSFSSIFASELEIEKEVKQWFAHALSGEDNAAYDSDKETDKVTCETRQDAENTTDIDRQTENDSPSFTADEKETTVYSDVAEYHSPTGSTTKKKMDDADDTPNGNQTENKMVAEINAPNEKTIDTFHEAKNETAVYSEIAEYHSPKGSTTNSKMDDADDTSNENQTENKMAAEINAPNENTYDTIDEAEKVNPDKAGSADGTKHSPYLKVLKIRKFIFFLIGILLYSVPEETIYMMFPNYCVENGSSSSEVAYLLSILGSCSTFSRFLMGILANSQTVDIYILFSLPFGILGVATLLLPFYVQTFTGRLLYVIIFGLYNCSVYSLLNELVTKITGVDNVTAAIGFVVVIKGVAGVFGPPLAEFGVPAGYVAIMEEGVTSMTAT